jgi:hypothetical protein
MTTWDYNPSFIGVIRNKIGYKLLDSLTRPLNELINQQRQEWGLIPYQNINQRYSPLPKLANNLPNLSFLGQIYPLTSTLLALSRFLHQKNDSFSLRKINRTTLDLCFPRYNSNSPTIDL